MQISGFHFVSKLTGVYLLQIPLFPDLTCLKSLSTVRSHVSSVVLVQISYYVRLPATVVTTVHRNYFSVNHRNADKLDI